MWVRVALPSLAGPIWGFDFPVDGRLLLTTAHGLVEITLVPAVEVRTLLTGEGVRALFDPARDCWFRWGGRRVDVNGPNGPGPTKVDHSNGDHIVVGDDVLLITDAAEEEVRQELDEFLVSDGDWAVAGFSKDEKYLVVCDARELRVFRPEGA